MKIQIPAFLISKRGLSASLRLHTGLRLWRQPCQQSRTNSNEETRPLFRPMLYRLAPPRFCLRFFLPLFRTSRPILFIATLRFFPLDAHLSEGGGRGIIPPYRDLVNDPIRRRNRVLLIRIPGLVLYDCLARIENRRHDFIRWINFLKISLLALLRCLVLKIIRVEFKTNGGKRNADRLHVDYFNYFPI